MKRLMFDGCAGWLHEAAGKAAATGVVLCAPHMHEAMWTHRGMRHLADDLAAAGIPVLRFDYYGTGDSAGDGGEPDFVPRAVQGVVAAAARLRALTGVENVVLCGLRLGAALAVLASEAMIAEPGHAPAALVLMSPVVNGRAYLRELRALGAFYAPEDGNGHAGAASPQSADDDGLEILSYRLAAEAMQQIGTLRLDRRPGVPAPRILLLDDAPGSTSAVASLARHYQQAGAHVDVMEFLDSRLMMKSPEVSAVPEASWRRIVEWLAPDAAATTAAPRPAEAGDTAFEVDGVVEHSVWIDNGRQFGVLCVPPDQTPPPAIVVFPNTGGSHHVGDGRAFVLLSRALARRGFAALRLDVSTLGDSPGAAREMAVPRAYAPGPRADVSAAVDWIRARGYSCIVMAGVCSGAYLSLQAALANEHVTGVVMANALKYLWRDEDDAAHHNGHERLRDYLHAARDARNWKRLMRGEFPLKVILAAPARVARGVMRKIAGGGRGRHAAGADDIEREYARGAMTKLSRHRVQLDLLYGVDDAGLVLAGRCFGDDFAHLHDLPCISAHRCAQLDHAMILAPSRDTFLAFLMQNLRRQLVLADAVRLEEQAATAPAAG
ncbi:MAG: alpha/beta hydrolase [Cupriavidus sp.]|nr:alpha/beta hydrolase [Cupriavidus sp.]